jgi:hypothetical protein
MLKDFPMPTYKNLGGSSGITFYEIGDDFIEVTLKDNSIYLYNYNRPGKLHVDKMKALAKAGSGLNSYIGLYVKKNYAK